MAAAAAAAVFAVAVAAIGVAATTATVTAVAAMAIVMAGLAESAAKATALSSAIPLQQCAANITISLKRDGQQRCLQQRQATGNNQPARQKDERAAQNKHQHNNSKGDNNNSNGDSGNNNNDGKQWWPASKANGISDGMDEDGEGQKIKYRKITYLLLNFTQLLPLTLPSLRPCFHASCLPWLVVVLSLVLCRLPSGGATIFPPLIAPPPLVMPLFFSGALPSCLPWLFVMSPLINLPPPIRLRLHLSLHRGLSLRPSCISCPADCCIASHYANAFCLLATLTLIMPLPLVVPLLVSFPLWLVVV